MPCAIITKIISSEITRGTRCGRVIIMIYRDKTLMVTKYNNIE